MHHYEPDFHPAWITDRSSPLIEKSLMALQEGGLKAELYTANYCTNGSYTAGVAKIPTIIFGPSSVSLAHQNDEYIAIQDLLDGADGYYQYRQQPGRRM